MKTNKSLWITVLLYAALWGLAEASLGYVLHFLPCGFAGLIMFPVGFYFMYNAYKFSGHRSAVLVVGAIAALIKTVDLILPLTSLVSVLNPVSSILIESLLVFGALRLFEGKMTVPAVFLVSTGWILLFILTQRFLLHPGDGLYLYPLGEMLFYVVLNIIVSGALILLYLKNEKRLSLKLQSETVVFAAPLILLFAIAVELSNTLI